MLARKQKKTDAKKSMQKLDWALTWVTCQVKQTGFIFYSARESVSFWKRSVKSDELTKRYRQIRQTDKI
jgi:hypothetical protein